MISYTQLSILKCRYRDPVEKVNGILKLLLLMLEDANTDILSHLDTGRCHTMCKYERGFRVCACTMQEVLCNERIQRRCSLNEKWAEVWSL